jgi:hypothetical protein
MRLPRTLTGPQEERTDMPVWLEILVNLSGYAGFVALATRGNACSRASGNDHVYSDER